MTAKRKPKRRPLFRVGQVVCEKETGLYRRIYSSQRVQDSFWYGLLKRDGVDFCIDQKRLRSLTKWEARR